MVQINFAFLATMGSLIPITCAYPFDAPNRMVATRSDKFVFERSHDVDSLEKRKGSFRISGGGLGKAIKEVAGDTIPDVLPQPATDPSPPPPPPLPPSIDLPVPLSPPSPPSPPLPPPAPPLPRPFDPSSFFDRLPRPAGFESPPLLLAPHPPFFGGLGPAVPPPGALESLSSTAQLPKETKKLEKTPKGGKVKKTAKINDSDKTKQTSKTSGKKVAREYY